MSQIEQQTDDAETQASNPPAEAQSMVMIDRTAPGWARLLSYVFSVSVGLCLLSVSIMSVFFQTLVAEGGSQILAPLLAIGGAVPVLGALVLEYGHTRALAGFRHARKLYERRAQAILAVAIFIILELMHPLLGLGVAIGVAPLALGLWLLGRYGRREPMWDMRPEEAVAALCGRDDTGLAMAKAPSPDHALAESMHRAATWLAVLVSLAAGSWLVDREVLSMTALAAVALLTYWSVDACGAYLRLMHERDPFIAKLSNSATITAASGDAANETDDLGLKVRDLSVFASDGRALLANIAFDLPPGSIAGVLGDPAAGKSLLLSALANPYDLPGLEIRGAAMMNGGDLWRRSAQERQPPAMLLPNEPLILPASGSENLTCFHDTVASDRGKAILEQLVFSSTAVNAICNAPDATRLSSSQRKALGFARAFLLGPSLYLIDRPEDGLQEQQMTGFLERLRSETRLGRSALLISQNRAVVESCDMLLVLQDGRLLDYGDAKEILDGLASGWKRFVSARSLTSIENLELWLRSQFKRDHDEANRRRVCQVASELLAISCETSTVLDEQNVSFEFKHFEGHCLLKMKDSEAPLSAAKLDHARSIATKADPNARLPHLASLIRNTLALDAGVELDHRVITAKIETYDPRKRASGAGAANALARA